MKTKIKFILSIIATLSCFTIIYWLVEYERLGIRFNRSESLPYTLFISKKNRTSPQKGTIVSCEHPKIPFPIAKIVAGVPGDNITLIENALFIDSTCVGELKTVSSSGKIYHPIEQGIIPLNHYFLQATHPESFDSRYIEFGLVQGSWIKEDLWPVF